MLKKTAKIYKTHIYTGLVIDNTRKQKYNVFDLGIEEIQSGDGLINRGGVVA